MRLSDDSYSNRSVSDRASRSDRTGYSDRPDRTGHYDRSGRTDIERGGRMNRYDRGDAGSQSDPRQSRSSYQGRGGSGFGSNSGTKGRILYDAHGVRIKNRGLAKWQRAILFYILPYLIVNGVIFLLVTATPSVALKVDDTTNYRTTQVEFTVKSLLPLKSLTASLESEQINYEKKGSTYTAEVSRNGNFYVETTALNGMKTSSFVTVSVLDDTPPSIDENSCVIEDGELTFQISDVESGVNFDDIYGIYDGTKEVKPTRIDKQTGTVTIPMYTDSITLHYEDMVGNAQAGTITATTAGTSSDSSSDVNVTESGSDNASGGSAFGDTGSSDTAA